MAFAHQVEKSIFGWKLEAQCWMLLCKVQNLNRLSSRIHHLTPNHKILTNLVNYCISMTLSVMAFRTFLKPANISSSAR